MANSDKNILITPSVGLSTNPTIKFNGANNTPTTLRVLDNGTVSFEGTSGQLFSIADSLSGSIFSVNDISGIPSIEVVDTGLVKINQYGGSTVFGSATAIQSSSANARVSISTASSTNPGLIIKAALNQSTNLLEIQNSSGTSIAAINGAGFVSLPSGLFVSGGGAQSTALLAQSGISTLAAIIAKGVASQTGNIQEWQNSSGTVLSRVDSSGTGRFPYIRVGSTLDGLYSASIYNSDPTLIGLAVKGAASQTANLTEWQNSAGTVRTLIDSGGGINTNANNNFNAASGFGGLGAFTNSSIIAISTNTASYIGLLIRGMASQTGDLQQWQNSAGTVLSKITADGGANFANGTVDINSGLGNFTIRNAGTTAYYVNSSLLVGTGYSGGIGVIIRGNGSQTADLQQWQSSAGAVLVKVDANGYMGSNGVYGTTGKWSLETAYGGGFMGLAKTTSAVANPGADIARMYLVAGTNAGTLKLVIKAGAAGAETTILDNIPQS